LFLIVIFVEVFSMSAMRSISWAFMALLIWVPQVQAASVTLPDFTELAADNATSVVKIWTVTNAKPAEHGGMSPDQEIPEIFKRFFGDIPFPQQDIRPQETSGSGFFVSSDGYILTNNHVVEGADEVTVTLTDRSEYDAKVIGTDPRTDLALLKVDGADFNAVTFGNSDRLKVGEWVLAIGSPFNLDYSVTAGIVSAMGRNIGENYVPFIQTDVAINPGNSGGPLYNLDGEVVGINSQIYTRSGGYMGVSFAIPANLAKNVYLQIRDKGSVSRGWLGVLIQQLDKDLAESYGLPRAQGALISQVLPESPAEKSGLKNGDVILRFNGIDIANSSELPPIVGTVLPGEKADVLVLRDGKRQIITVTIEELPEDLAAARTGAAEPDRAPNNALNIRTQDLSIEEQSMVGESGVMVTQVYPGSGQDAGLAAGDVITMMGNRGITSDAQFQSLQTQLKPGHVVAVRLLRNGSPLFIAVRIR